MAPNSENLKKEMAGFEEIKENKAPAKTKNNQIKSYLVLDVGHYSAASIPLAISTVVFFMLYFSSQNKTPHPLTEGRFLLDNMPFIVSVVFGYLVFCTVWGPRIMKNREPIKMKETIKYYNIFQVLICIYMFYEFGVAGWFGNYNYHCEPLKYTSEPNEVRMASVVYIYYLTKLLDLLDTFFFVLNKKWGNVSVLHLVHHSTMVLNLWFACLYIPRGQITFSMFINSFIHIVMYGYYYLASLGPAVRPYLWWKKYLTVLQIIQLASIFIHASQVLFNGCNVNLGLMGVSIFCSFIYILLFLDFYVNSYSQKTRRPNVGAEVQENAHSDSSSNLKQRNNLNNTQSTVSQIRKNVTQKN